MPYLSSEHAGGIEIYYESSGSGEPVVMIGGLTSTLEAWGLQVPALAPRYRVLRPDNPGSGRTRLHADDGVRSFDRFAGDILALVAGSGEIERGGPDAVAEGARGVQFVAERPEELAPDVIDFAGRPFSEELRFAFSHPKSLLGVLFEFIEYPPGYATP